MKNATIEELAYILKQAKKNDQGRAIFFIGAGASVTGGIPLAKEIVQDILARYKDNPRIKGLAENERNEYSELLNCLTPFQRDKLLKEYIYNAKINVTHIYLALLIINDFVDYVLTVNFDNLLLRALSLFNEFPPTYDMAILNDLTTTSFKKKSVVYLHGQHHGLWLLNTPEEMEKVRETVPRIFDSIKSGRPWVFLGYSASDPIFDHIKKLGRFDNGLYWVTYQDNDPKDNVRKFLGKQNTNAYLIKDYDADSFMLKLNSELGLGQPAIIDRPFSSLKKLLNNIVDIDEEDHFKNVKQRLTIAHKQVDEAIKQFEEGKVRKSTPDIRRSSEIDLLKKKIINLIVAENYSYSKIKNIKSRAEKLNDDGVNDLVAGYYVNRGISLGELADTKEGKEAEDLYRQAFIKFQEAIDIKPDKHDAYYNWGFGLGKLADTKEGKEAEDLYRQAVEKYQKSTEIKHDGHDAYHNWGASLGKLADTKEGREAEDLYRQAFEKYQKAIEIKPDKYAAYYNWGTELGKLADTKEGKEAEDLYRQAFIKFQEAIDIKPDKHDAYYNWGFGLGKLADTKEGKESEDLYWQAVKKYQKAIDIKPSKYEAIQSLGSVLGKLADTKEDKEAEDLYRQAYDRFKEAVELGGSAYNLSCHYALKSDKENAFLYLKKSLTNGEITSKFVMGDEDWVNYHSNRDFINLINKYKK